ncbi:MAG: hypothetical protein LBC97_02290 [Bifidobacteriaceae bacterium]|jgi:hypothetical protein|nr:hypothetical protein [Bifidobacteriaceae bacterium]
MGRIYLVLFAGKFALAGLLALGGAAGLLFGWPGWVCGIAFFLSVLVLALTAMDLCVHRMVARPLALTWTDFPASRNFDALIVGGKEAWLRHGFKATFGDAKTLSLCLPGQEERLSTLVVMRYHSYLRKGGTVVYYLDPAAEKGRALRSYANLSMLHPMDQRRLTGKMLRKWDRMAPLVFYPWTIQLPAALLRAAIRRRRVEPAECPPGEPPAPLLDFCRERGYKLDYLVVGDARPS